MRPSRFDPRNFFKAAVVAALKKLRRSKRLGRKEQIVLLITGHGLKDVEAAMRKIQIPASVEPTLSGVQAALKIAAVKGGPCRS